MPLKAPSAADIAARTSRVVLVVRRVCLPLGYVLASLTIGAVAWAFWGNVGDGVSTAVTGTLTAPTDVTASAPLNSGTVAVSWTGAALGTGQPASGYYVVRVRNSDGATFPGCGTSAASPRSALTCSDLGVTDGDYSYTVTAVVGSWSAVSAVGNTVTVVNDNSAPTMTVTSVTPTPNGNGYNSSSPVTVNLTATAGFGIASITYTIDSGSPVTVTTSTAAVSVSGDGIHTISFSARDNTARDSQTGTDLVRIDTVAPAAPPAPVLAAASDSGPSSSDGYTKVTTPTFTGAAESGTTVTLYDGATAVGSGVATGGAYSITSSTLAAGNRSMSVRATDLAGNVGPASASTTFTIDTTAPVAPSAPILTTASDSGLSSSDRITNVTTPTFTGTAEAGSTVTLYNGATAVGTAFATGGAYSVTSSALTTGTLAMTVKATDLAANLGPASASTSITIDITAPTKPGTPVLTAASDSGRSAVDRITKVTTPTVTGSTTAGYLVTLYDGATQVASITAASTTYSLTSTTLTNAVHTITTKNTDVAGNLGPASTALSVTVDTVAPLAPSVPKANAASDTGKSSTDGITKVTTPVITGTNESLAIVTLYDGVTQLGAVTTTTTTSSITSPVLAEGTHTLTATSTDVAGNLGPASAAGTLVIDTTAPTTSASTPTLSAASDTGASNSDRITKTTTPVFTGTAATGDTVTLFDGATASGALVIAAGDAYSATTAALLSGNHTITAVETDVAGNAAPTTPGTVVTIDTVVPTVTINQAAGQADPATSSPIAFTAIFSEPVTGFVSASVSFTGTALGSTATVSGSGPTYNVSVGGLTRSGTVIPAIIAGKGTDVAGNVSTAATFTDTSVTYTDVTAPLAPSTPLLATASDTGSSTTDGITTDTTPTYSGTAEIGSTVKLFDGATPVGSVVVAAGGTYSITPAALANGARTITATATDPSGNISPPSAGVSLTIDTVAPTVTINQAAAQADPTTASPIGFTVVFSEPVVGFVTGDVTIGGTALATAATVSGSGTTYDVAASGMTKTGTVILTLAAAKATDLAGTSNTAATFGDNSVNYTDVTAPAAPSTPLLSAASDTGSSSTDAITNDTTATFTGTAEVGSTVKLFDGVTQVGSVGATVGTYAITTSVLSTGAHTITATATDTALNVSLASAGTIVTIDTTKPTVTLNQAAGQGDPTTVSPIDFTATFSEPVSGFTSSDVTFTGTAGATTATISGGPAVYTVSASGMTTTGSVTPAIAAAMATDVAGNTSTASTFTDQTVTYTDNAAPAVSITTFTAAADASQTATIAGTAGFGPGDNLTVTVVLCTQNAYPCILANTKVTLSGVPVSATTGAWTVTSASLGSTPTLYGKATQTDLSGNAGASAVAGPIAIP